MFLHLAADTASNVISFSDLGLHPVALEIGAFKIRWYSLAYISGIILGWWYLVKLLAQPGAPMARRHADDFVFYVTLGIILGGRLGFCLFYRPGIFLTPLDVFKIWEGGMSFHGGILGGIAAVMWLVRKEKLNWMRVMDYVCCTVPGGMFFGRLANFVNQELWGKPTDGSWGVIFPLAGPEPRHPSQLYEAGLEGLALGLILWFLFWRTQARYQPGRLLGAAVALIALFRFGVEFFREPDPGVYGLFGMSMGQTLSIPMILAGAWLFFTAKARRTRVEPVAGTSSVA